MTKIQYAVAAALALGASAAQAGIDIPAGDWTIDFGGNVNAYYTNTRFSGSMYDAAKTAGNTLTSKTANEVSTGLLPSAIGIGGKTRQNDLDIAFQFTFFTGINAQGFGSGGNASNGAQGNSLNIRQAYMTFGDKSWGTIKAGRDLGLFGSDAILSDMTLLGVGQGAGGAGNSTLGRIGSGYEYADWVGQIQYASPNWNGFSFAAALREPWGNTTNHDLGFDAKASYEWAGDFSGKVWVGGVTQKTTISNVGTGRSAVAAVANQTRRSEAGEIGAKVGYAGAELVGYYYEGKNMGVPATVNATEVTGLTLGSVAAGDFDVSGGYVQATYKLPTVGTKIGISWGESLIDTPSGTVGGSQYKDESWVVGVYHPLTKSLNLVAEYTDTKIDNNAWTTGSNGKARTAALGAILFF
jgi:predicted porin